MAKDCSACDWHKGKANRKKGKLIPGEHGKCTRPEGLCKGKKKADPATEAALSVVDAEKKTAEIAENEQERRERLIAQAHRIIGRIETAELFGKTATVAGLVWLKEMRESKIYREIPGIGTWEKFCNHLGKSRRTIDEQLQNLEIFGEEFTATCRRFSIGHHDLRKLRKQVTDGTISIDEKTVIIAGETIPFEPAYKEDLQEAIECVLDDKDQALKEKTEELKAEKRVQKEKEKVIRKQEREIAKHVREIKERGFKPGEEAFLEELERVKLELTGLELQMDPENMPEDMTPLMRAEYLTTLDHFRQTICAYYDQAEAMYGAAISEDDWVQPGLDAEATEITGAAE